MESEDQSGFSGRKSSWCFNAKAEKAASKDEEQHQRSLFRTALWDQHEQQEQLRFAKFPNSQVCDKGFEVEGDLYHIQRTRKKFVLDVFANRKN